MCYQCLREEKSLSDVTIHSLNLLIYPLEEDLISNEIDNSFKSVFFEFFQNRRLYLRKDRSIPLEVIDTILQLQQLSSGIYEIHSLGGIAETILETIQKQKNTFLQSAIDPTKPAIRHLILVDRAVDFNSLFVTPLTYEGLIDDLIGIQVGHTEVDAEMIGRVFLFSF